VHGSITTNNHPPLDFQLCFVVLTHACLMQLAPLAFCCFLMLLARTPILRVAQPNPYAIIADSSLKCASRRPLAVIASSKKAFGTDAMAEVKDVAPTVLNTVQMTIKYGGTTVTDGQHLGKAQVRPRTSGSVINTWMSVALYRRYVAPVASYNVFPLRFNGCLPHETPRQGGANSSSSSSSRSRSSSSNSNTVIVPPSSSHNAARDCMLMCSLIDIPVQIAPRLATSIVAMFTLLS
jgi:hypothetical protein